MTDTTLTATPLVAAGTLFTRGDSILLVHRTIYANGWDIPGSLVAAGESPAAASSRQLRADLRLDRTPQRLLVIDWVPGEHDEFLYVFDGGDIRDDEVRPVYGRNGLDRWDWVPVDRLTHHVPPELARRFTMAHEVRSRGDVLYLERGNIVTG